MGRRIDRHGVRVEEMRPFPAVAEANPNRRATGAGSKATAEQPLEFERRVRADTTGQFLQPTGEAPQSARTAELIAGKKESAGQIRIPFQQWGKRGVGQPSELDVRKLLLQ